MVVAITGASAGIGRAVAELAAREGHAVVLFARREDRLAALARSLSAQGGRAIAVAGDVTSAHDNDALVARALDAFGRLDVLICNAGIGYHGTIEDTPPDVMRRLVDVNLMGTLYGVRAAVPVFRRQNSGHLIAVSSIVGRRGVAGASVYSATKAAQAALVEGLRAEWAGTGLRASTIFPVSTATEFRDAERRDYGRHVTGHGPAQSAETVARAVVACMRSQRRDVYPYRPARLLAVLNVAAPALADRITRRFGRKVESASE